MQIVELVPVEQREKPALWDMLQLYLMELSAFGDRPPGADGKFAYRYFDHYWGEEAGRTRWAYWIVSDGQRAGFALVRMHDDGILSMAEFYVVEEQRGSGAAREAAHLLFERFRGKWHVSELKQNARAVAFWRRVTAPYGYSETINEERIEQRLDTSVTDPN